MTTESFERGFHIKDHKSIRLLLKDITAPNYRYIPKKDYDAEDRKSVELLKKRINNDKGI